MYYFIKIHKLIMYGILTKITIPRDFMGLQIQPFSLFPPHYENPFTGRYVILYAGSYSSRELFSKTCAFLLVFVY